MGNNPNQFNILKQFLKIEKRSGSIMFLRFETINLKNGFLNFFEIELNNEKSYDLVFIS